MCHHWCTFHATGDPSDVLEDLLPDYQISFGEPILECVDILIGSVAELYDLLASNTHHGQCSAATLVEYHSEAAA